MKPKISKKEISRKCPRCGRNYLSIVECRFCGYQIILQPSCSEYVFHLKLTKAEKKIAIRMAKKIIKNKDDLKWFINDNTSPLFAEEDNKFSFTNEEYVEPYTAIKTFILTKRGKGKIRKNDIIKLN